MSLNAGPAPALRILVVSQSAERRKALCAKLAEKADLEPAEVSPAGLHAAMDGVAGATVIMDVEGEQADPAAKLARTGASVILLADDPEAGWVGQALAAGVKGVLRHDCSGEQMAAAVCAVATGLIALETDAAQALLRPPLESAELEPGEEELTARETEVLHMMTAGLSNREIASTLGISEHTVKFHITSIFGKLGTSSRTEAVTEGIRRGLILL